MSQELKALIGDTQDEFEGSLARLNEAIFKLEQQWERTDDLAGVQERVEEVCAEAFKMKGHADFCAGLEVARDRLKGEK